MALLLSKAVLVGDTAYVGGVTLVDENGGIPEGVGRQMTAVMDKVDRVLADMGMNKSDIVFATVYLNDMDNYKEMNNVYSSLMSWPYPACKVIMTEFAQVGMLVEMILTAARGEKINF